MNINQKLRSKALITASLITLTVMILIHSPRALGQEPAGPAPPIPPPPTDLWAPTDKDDGIFNTNIGNVGIGTSNPGLKLDVRSAMAAIARFGTSESADSKVLINSLSGYGANLVFQSADEDKWFLGNRASNNRFSFMEASGAIEVFSILQNGSVGVGTITPGFRFDVQGGQINSSGGLCIAGDCKTSWSQVGGGSSQWTTSGANIYYNAGNVGIGTATPGSLFEVNKSQNAGTALVVDNGYSSISNGAYSGIFFKQAGVNRFFLGSNNDGNSIQNGGPGATQLWNFANGPTLFATNNAERLRITATGNVGIGTNNPVAGLDVQVPINAVTAYGVRLQQALTAGNNNAELNGLFINPSFINGQAVGVRHNALVTIAGNVGIGSSATSAGLDVQNEGVATVSTNATFGSRFQQAMPSSGNNGISTAVYINPAFNDGQAVAVRHNGLVVAAGDVGIGTMTPIAKLDVQGGQVNASGGLCIAGDCKSAWSQVGGSQWSNSGSSISFNTGNVGIGIINPHTKLHLVTPSQTAEGLRVSATDNHFLQIHASSGQGSWNGLAQAGDTSLIFSNGGIGAGGGFVIAPWAAATSGLRVNGNGYVGIGTANPTKALDVVGDINVSGNINAKYQDMAEWVESSQALAAGTVVVLDQTKSNQVIASSQAYDTRVAGVISAQPGITLGERGEGKVLVATTGRVRIKVDATRGPIQIGDLLVTGDKEGTAMKSQSINVGGVQIHRPGTLIGKALEPLATGRGEILVLLSLQ